MTDGEDPIKKYKQLRALGLSEAEAYKKVHGIEKPVDPNHPLTDANIRVLDAMTVDLWQFANKLGKSANTDHQNIAINFSKIRKQLIATIKDLKHE